MKKNLILMSALFAGSMIVNSGFGANLERNSTKREHDTELETDMAAKKEEIKKNYKALIDNIIDIACEKIPSTRDSIFFTHRDCVFNHQRYTETTYYSFKYLTDFIKFAGVRALPIITKNNLPLNKDKLSDLSTCIRKYVPYSFEASMELTRVSQIIDIMLH